MKIEMIEPQALISPNIDNSAAEESRIHESVESDLDKDAFFELLVTQLRHQDPMEPLDNREFISQMAQFSSLEQMQQMNSQMEQFLEGKNLAEKTSLIGKNVEINQNGEVITGEIEKIALEDSEIYAVLEDDTKVNVEEINKIY